MVPLIAAIGIGGIAYVAVTSFKKRWDELQAEERAKAKGPKSAGNLEQDPKTGRYRPKR
ncbi:MAG: hypothetical protein AAFO70_09020 [Pseudomonadota bacterium]